MKNKNELINEINNIVEDNNMELVEVNIKSKTNPLVEVIIYKPEGITLDDCSHITKEIDSKLGLDDYFTDNYNIEVGSPGLDRKLTTLDDYRRNLNNKIELSLYSKLNNSKEFIGTLEDYDDISVMINVEGELIKIERKNIAKMTQYLDFGR